MAEVTWTDQALDDLDAVCLFIARDAPRYAERFADRLFETAQHLATFPRAGRVVSEFGREDVRETIVQNYRVVYRVLPDEVEILTIHHGAGC
jgi:toxin ParE1/3/4